MNINGFFAGIIDSIINGLKSRITSLPVLIGIILGIAFISMLIVTIWTLISMKRSEMNARNIFDLPPSAMKNKDEEDESINEDQFVDNNNHRVLPYVGEFINKYLITKGYIRVHSIVRSFFKAMEFLKNSLGKGYKYKLPWFLILGTENSGKSSLLNGFTSDDIFDDDERDDSDCTWWFLKGGVVLDIKGEDLILKDACHSNEKNWYLIFDMLSRYRSEKPINGIILTIPCDELYGKNKRNIEDIKKRALHISRKLSFAQNYLGLKLPVYIVITKTDVIPGFQSFCSEIPVRNRNNMLGWSNPFVLDSLYSSLWIDEAFDSIEDELNEIRMEIFAESNISSTIDGVFVFPSELLTIKEYLKIYIDSIFKNGSVEERFYLRGIYFTGDSKMVPLLQLDKSNNNQPMAILGTPDADINEAGNLTASFRNEEYAPKKIFFFEDLLLKKIFVEEGIASPMKTKVYQTNKSIFISKISTATFVIIGSYGLFNAKDQLYNNRNSLYPSLFKISSIIQDVGNLTMKNLEDNGNEILSECSSKLLMMMQQINNARFSSIFVPASWFSSINGELKETLRISYQRVVVRTIYMNLILKARSLLNLEPSKNDVSKNIGELLNPYKSREYMLMKSYISGLIELEKNIKKFDSLRSSGDPKDLNDLINYTFNGSLPNEFLENYEQYRSILMNTPFPSIDLSPYKKVAYDVLIKLFQNYLDAIFTNRSKNSIISTLNQFIDSIVKQNISKIPDFKGLKDFSNQLTEVCRELGDEGKTWLDNDVFASDKEYDKFLDDVESLFGKDVAQNILDITAVNFGYLKARLLEFNNLIESDISNNKKIEENKKKEQKSLPLSHGIFKIQRCLSSLCQEPYMIEPQDYKLITEIPEGKMIFWDDEMIQYAYDMGKRYDQFFSSKIKEFPRSMQEGITLLTKSNLCSVISGCVAKAQSFVDVPNTLTDELFSEELLQKQVTELKGVAPKFISLMKILKDDKVSFIFGDLRTILNRIGFTLLYHIDKLLENQKPYLPANLNFGYWDGEQGAGYQAYSISDNDELLYYIKLQRKHINRLAIEFAEPVVQFLNSDLVFDQNFGNHNQLTKWTRIVDNVKGFLKKDPMNSISILEKFITKTLNTYTLDNITDLIPLKDIRGDSGDYFLSIIKQIKKGILSKSEILIRKRNISRYNSLRDFYKKHLENKYPFSNYDKSQRVSIDADIEFVKEFFRMYDEFGGSPEKILDQIYQLGNDAKNMYDFLKRIHELRIFMGDSIYNNHDSLKVSLDMDFEINKREEKNTDYLVDRIFKPNNDANIEFINSDKSGMWYFGEPIEFDLRWASGNNDPSAQSPTYDPNDPDIIIDDEKLVRIQCQGNWAALRFLQKYRAETGNLDKVLPNENILCFRIPLNNGKISKVYAGITIFLPKKPGDSNMTSVKLPRTPEEMPEVSKNVLGVMDQPVLVEKSETNGIVEKDDDHNNNDDKNIINEDEEEIISNNNSNKNKDQSKSSNKSQNINKQKNDKKQNNSSENNESNKSEDQEVVDILESDKIPSLEDEDESLIQVNEEPIT